MSLVRLFINSAIVVASFAFLVKQLAPVVLPESFAWNVAPDDLSAPPMRAIRYHVHGPATLLRVDSVLRPKPLPDQILVEVAYASLNPCDFKFRRNHAPLFAVPLPKIPGADIAGVVVEAPLGSPFKVGDRVAAMLPLMGTKWGALAEFVAVDWKHAARVPEGLGLAEAAALPLVALTVSQAFASAGFSLGALNAASATAPAAHEVESEIDALPLHGKVVLVHAGSGGVGSFAVQYAKNVLGAHWVVATCSPG